MGDDDELRPLRIRAEQVEETIDVEVIERRLDLVEDVEGARAREEHGEEERERGHRLLPTGEQGQPLHRLAGGRDLDLDAEQILIAGPVLPAGAGVDIGVLGPLRGIALEHRDGPAEDGRRAIPLGDEPQTPVAAREQPRGEFLEVGGGRLEGLLEGLADLPVRVPNQLFQLSHRRLEVRPLTLELFNVLERLRVFVGCERVHRPELLTATFETLKPRAQCLARFGIEHILRRFGGELELLCERLQDLADVLSLVTPALCAHLERRQTLVVRVQRILDPRLLLRAGAQTRGDVLSRFAVGGQGRLELTPAQLDRLRSLAERDDEVREHRFEPLVARDRHPELLDPGEPLGALPGGPIPSRLLGEQFAAELCPATGARTLVGRLPAPLDRHRQTSSLLGRLIALADRRTVRSDRAFVIAVTLGDDAGSGFESGAGALLVLCGGLARGDQLLTAVALGEDALLAHRRRLADLAGACRPHPALAGDGHPAEGSGHGIDRVDKPHVGQELAHKASRLHRRHGHTRSGAQRPPAGRSTHGSDPAPVRSGSDRSRARAPVGAGAVKEFRRDGEVGRDRGTESPVEGRGDGQFVSGRDRQRLRQRSRAPERGALAPQERVDSGELSSDSRSLAPGALDLALRLADSEARLAERAFRALSLGLGDRDGLGEPDLSFGDGRAIMLECLQLTFELGLTVALERLELGCERRDPLFAAVVGRLSGLLGEHDLESSAVASKPRRDGCSRLRDGLDPVGQPFARRLGGESAAGELLTLGAARGQSLLGLLPTSPDVVELALEIGPARARLGDSPFCDLEFGELRTQLLTAELVPRLEPLPMEAGVELRRFRLALERPQPRAGLPLNIERTVEVVLGVAELQLGTPTALAVLTEPGGLLDQQPAVPRLGGDDRFDPALRDDRVHLLPEPRVGQQLDHVDQATAGAGDPVLALAGAVQTAQDRDLGNAEAEGALAVVEDELDLGRAGSLSSRRATEDDVLHRLSAHRQGRLLPERPEDGIGHVRLTGAVGPDDHADAGTELEPRPVGKRFEPLEGDALQVHGRSAPHRLERRLRGLLLGVLLAPALATADLGSIDPRDDAERPVVRWPLLGDDGVGDERAATRKPLLQFRLEVNGPLERVGELGRERVDDRLRRAPVSERQVAGSDHRLDHGREHALGRKQRGNGRRGGRRRRLGDPRRQTAGARRPRDTSARRPSAHGSS